MKISFFLNFSSKYKTSETLHDGSWYPKNSLQNPAWLFIYDSLRWWGDLPPFPFIPSPSPSFPCPLLPSLPSLPPRTPHFLLAVGFTLHQLPFSIFFPYYFFCFRICSITHFLYIQFLSQFKIYFLVRCKSFGLFIGYILNFRSVLSLYYILRFCFPALLIPKNMVAVGGF